MPTDEAKIEACARAAHEVNRAYCLALGDSSQPAWEAAPDWQVTSAITGVLGVLKGNGPRESHESWLELKRATGWAYGPVKDPEKKTHPCFVPYDELPEAQKSKDALFVATVTAMASALGLAKLPSLGNPSDGL
jgi:RyR domain-containing protein